MQLTTIITLCFKKEHLFFFTVMMPFLLSGIAPELISSENLLHSIAAALHLGNQPITGQTASRAQLQRNLGVSVIADQPLMQVTCVALLWLLCRSSARVFWHSEQLTARHINQRIVSRN
jgi:hypothetical protein